CFMGAAVGGGSVFTPRDRRAAGDPAAGAARAVRGAGGYLAAAPYFAGLSFAFFAQSSQQTVVSLPPTFTLIPSAWIFQSHTGHFFVFMRPPLKRERTERSPRPPRAILRKTG